MIKKATLKQIIRREKVVRKFLAKCFAGFDRFIGYDVEVNDDSEPGNTCFLVTIHNNSNKDTCTQILVANGNGVHGIIRGEDEDGVDVQSFLVWCFLDGIMTWPEC